MRYKPSISDFSPFDLPTPFITYDISNYFGASEDLDAYDDLEEKALFVFQENTLKNEYIYALDWQHECFWVNPHLEVEKTSSENGKYQFSQMEFITSLSKRILNGGI